MSSRSSVRPVVPRETKGGDVADDPVCIRPAVEDDVEAVRDIFFEAYGDEYPFKQFYDLHWLKKAVFDDDTLFLVGEVDGALAGTASAVFTSGSLSDLIGEFGRLVIGPKAQGHGLGTRLFREAVAGCEERIQFGFAEARTAHEATQKICDRTGFAAVGFQPLKYALRDRESTVLYARLLGRGLELRRNNPRVIPEAAALAMHAVDAMCLPGDVVVVEDEPGYPVADDVEIDALSETGWSPLLRIERGRVRGREVFGNLSLAHGFFKIKAEASRYLVARRGSVVVGGLGFHHDPVDAKVRLFELIAFSDGVKGRLLVEADRLAREDLGAVYQEIDVSAHAPALQRTLERLGFMAVGYGPSMVFENVDRVDVVRMVKLTAPYFRSPVPMTGPAAGVRDLVEEAMRDRREGGAVADAARGADLFRGLEEGDMYHLARVGRVARLEGGETLIRQGQPADRLFILVQGGLHVRVDGREVARLRPGETVGEVALLDSGPRSADVVTEGETTVVEFLVRDLEHLVAARPRLGRTVMENLGRALASRLRALDARQTGEQAGEQTGKA
jgi:predicted GNAT family N-acyltransferase